MNVELNEVYSFVRQVMHSLDDEVQKKKLCTACSILEKQIRIVDVTTISSCEGCVKAIEAARNFCKRCHEDYELEERIQKQKNLGIKEE